MWTWGRWWEKEGFGLEGGGGGVGVDPSSKRPSWVSREGGGEEEMKKKEKKDERKIRTEKDKKICLNAETGRELAEADT